MRELPVAVRAGSIFHPCLRQNPASAVERFLKTQAWPKLLIVEATQDSVVPFIMQHRSPDLEEKYLPWESGKKSKLRVWIFKNYP